MKIEKIEFKNSKGMRIVGELQIPEGSGKFPAVIVCHGFKGGKQQPHIKRIADDLTKEGFVTLRFDFTNNPGESEGDLYDVTVTGELDDLNKAIDFVKSLDYVNENIGITGHSLGGFVCLKVASERNDIKCLVTLSSLFDFKGAHVLKTSFKEAKEKGYFITESITTYFKKFKVSVNFFEDGLKYDLSKDVKKIKCPTLVIHGDKDESIPLEQAKDLFNALECEKDLKIIKDAPKHNYVTEPQMTNVSKEAVNWFKRYLK
jgi:dipeptidyl aminopeptidase/acylaminoacyl peptidase